MTYFCDVGCKILYQLGHKTLSQSMGVLNEIVVLYQEAISWLKSSESGAAGQAFSEFIKRHGHRCAREVSQSCSLIYVM